MQSTNSQGMSFVEQELDRVNQKVDSLGTKKISNFRKSKSNEDMLATLMKQNPQVAARQESNSMVNSYYR